MSRSNEFFHLFILFYKSDIQQMITEQAQKDSHP